ncbi:MAG: O-antigen ligase family protein [Blastocatellia bacterium]
MNHPDSLDTWPATLTKLRGRRRVRGRLFGSSFGFGGGAWRRAKNDRGPGDRPRPKEPGGPNARRQEEQRDPYRWAFGFLYLFTILLYIRPSDLLPALESFPLAKIVAILAFVVFAGARYNHSKSVINWTTEVKMVFVMLFLALLFTPIAASPRDSIDTLNDVFVKIVTVFILIIGLVNTRARLRSMISLSVLCGTWLAIFAIKDYATGNFNVKSGRIAGVVGGIFGNPNDLAMALNMLIPLAVALALVSAGRVRLFYLASALMMTAGVIVTFSRAGFIALVALAGILIWKFGRGMRLKAMLGALIPSIILLAAVSDTYHNRLTSIVDHDKDETGSARQRSELLKFSLDLAIRHPFIGVGIGNFHVYSIREKGAHNAYLETAAELGSFGLVAYLIVILGSFRGVARIERETLRARRRDDLYLRSLSIGLQAALGAYIVNSFFASTQYLWYLYYVAGFAVALRGIYAAERAVRVKAKEAEAPDQPQLIGNLWKSAPRKPAGVLWPAYRFRRGF